MKKILPLGLLAGVVILVAGLVINWLSGLVWSLQTEYMNGLYRPWTDPLMMVFFLYPFILGLALAWFWPKVKNNFSGRPCKQAAKLAGMYFIIATLPGMFITYTTFNVSLAMVVSWAVGGVVEVWLSGLIFAKWHN